MKVSRGSLISVASGKGGTGKTTFSVALAKVIAETEGRAVLADCDVEEPNSHLFLSIPFTTHTPVMLPVPTLDEERCTACGACAAFCRYNAVALFNGKVMLFSDICHHCGGCVLACPHDALSEREKETGVIHTGEGEGLTLLTGELNVGEKTGVPVITRVRKELTAYIAEGTPIIVDAPPGTSCSVIEAVDGSDFVILVTEPTPFGLNDLRLAVSVVRALGIPFGVVINKAGIGDAHVSEYCATEAIPILLEIPHSTRIAEAYARGENILAQDATLRNGMLRLQEHIRKAL